MASQLRFRSRSHHYEPFTAGSGDVIARLRIDPPGSVIAAQLDGKKGKPQIAHGLLCAADGHPVAIEVFDGDTADPATLASQISKLKQRFGVSRVVLVGDRGMITQARTQ